MIQYIKKQLTIFLIIFSIFGVSFFLYQSQDININTLKEQAHSMENTITKSKKELKKMEKEIKKNNEFFMKHRNLYIIDKPETLDPFRFEEKLRKDLYLLFGNGVKLKFNDKFKKIGSTDYVAYKAIINFPYKNRIQLYKFFKYLNSNYMYRFQSLKYKARNNTFVLEIEFIGKNGKTIFKKKRRRR